MVKSVVACCTVLCKLAQRITRAPFWGLLINGVNRRSRGLSYPILESNLSTSSFKTNFLFLLSFLLFFHPSKRVVNFFFFYIYIARTELDFSLQQSTFYLNLITSLERFRKFSFLQITIPRISREINLSWRMKKWDKRERERERKKIKNYSIFCPVLIASKHATCQRIKREAKYSSRLALLWQCTNE